MERGATGRGRRRDRAAPVLRRCWLLSGWGALTAAREDEAGGDVGRRGLVGLLPRGAGWQWDFLFEDYRG